MTLTNPSPALKARDLDGMLPNISQPGGGAAEALVGLLNIAEEIEAAANGLPSLTTLASTANGDGASLVGIEDAGTYFTGTDVEAALQEVGLMLSALDPNLKRFTTVVGAEGAVAADAIEVAVTLVDGNGTAITTQPACIVKSQAVTPDKGDLAAAGTPVGTLVQAINPTTGQNIAAFTPTVGGLFSFRVTDTSAEKVLVTIEGAGFETQVLVLTFA